MLPISLSCLYKLYVSELYPIKANNESLCVLHCSHWTFLELLVHNRASEHACVSVRLIAVWLRKIASVSVLLFAREKLSWVNITGSRRMTGLVCVCRLNAGQQLAIRYVSTVVIKMHTNCLKGLSESEMFTRSFSTRCWFVWRFCELAGANSFS